MSNRWQHLSAAVVLGLALGGCGGPADDAGDDLAASEDGLSARSSTHVTLRHDTRRCMAPLCGGYFAHDVNRKTADVYVNGLDFSKSGLSDRDVEAVRAAQPGELVVKGKLGAADSRGTRALVVLEAWVGLPGMTLASGDAFYTAKARDPQVQCLVAPCHNLVAAKLATSSKPAFTRLEVGPAAKPLVDVAWLGSRVLTHGAIVAAHLESGQRFPGGLEKVLEASQVFVRVPATIGSCPTFPIARCPQGKVMQFSRNPERCIRPIGCVEPRACPLRVPRCDDGYALASWSGDAGACMTYACDPLFSLSR